MRKLAFMLLLAALLFGVIPFVNSANYIKDNNYYWTCLSKGESLERFVCNHDCCQTCQKNGFTAPWYNCVGSPCGCGGGGAASDTTPPSFTVAGPVDNFVSGSRAIPFSIQASELVDLYYKDSADALRGFKKVCSNCNSFDDKISFSEGTHTITLLAADSGNNQVEQVRTFFVDSKKPRIRATFPKVKGYSNGTFTVQYDENNVRNIKLAYTQGNGYQFVTKTDCPSGTKQSCAFSVSGLSQGVVSYYFVVEDPLATVQSKELSVIVDSIVPVLDVAQPESKSYDASVIFDLDVSEDVTLEYMDHSQRSPRWAKLCSKCDNYFKKKTLTKGSHTMDIRATDLAGNSIIRTIPFSIS